jgi:tRNA threonylcarbamoyladenosine biosynthesis protein TsaB
MKVLGVDTATTGGGIGIIDDEKVLAEYTFEAGDTPSARLIPAIQGVLDQAGLDLATLDAIAVSLGPGSFTGVRVGLSAVKGLSLAGGMPVLGVPSLDALAAQLPRQRTPNLICPLIDARKGEVYAALYKRPEEGGLERVTPYQVLSPHALLVQVPLQETTFLGDGVEVYQKLIKEQLGERALFAPPELQFLKGQTVAVLGRERLERGGRDDVASLVPLYIRPSEAEIKRAESTPRC